ncbi:MAG: metallophosphoesterase family protein [Planctomycetota bacterium]|nr:metallophosphoesterase family protein [Planctomycetota bacterium]
MRTALISDIHGNLEAVQAVLNDIAEQNVARTICLGDVIGYGPNPRECIDEVRNLDLCILGNHDQGALFDPEGFSGTAERAIYWTRSQLEDKSDEKNPQRWQFLAELPRVIRENRVLFVHGSARAPLSEYVFPEDIYNPKKMDSLFSLVQTQCFQGHTHVPGIFTADHQFISPADIDGKFPINQQKLIINVGSVGQPRDLDCRSCYVIWDGETIEYRRVEYPVEVTRQKIKDIDDLDDFLGDRLGEGR